MSRTPAYSVNLDPKSPFYFVSFVGPDGKLKRRLSSVNRKTIGPLNPRWFFLARRPPASLLIALG